MDSASESDIMITVLTIGTPKPVHPAIAVAATRDDDFISASVNAYILLRTNLVPKRSAFVY